MWRSAGVIFAIVVLTACGTGEQQLSDEVRELTVTDDEIIDYRGNTLWQISQLPDDIEVEEGTEFHAHERFVQASMSKDGRYLALTTSGTAHSAGWIVEPERERVNPVTFQYGGGVTLGPWRPDSKFMVMFTEPASGARLLSVVDISRVDHDFVQRSDQIEIPQHDDISPQQQRYQVIDWEEGLLHFLMAGESWIYDPESREFE